MRIIVFTGPTLSPAEVSREIDAECLPPAAQGDIYRAALRRPAAIGIIDGYFESVPSVWHKEILWAMAEGIHVFGSASMGALRAAELASFGMIGVGAIFEAYRDGLLEDDDEVAVAHGPTGETFRFCSDAMVNIRATLARALAETVIQPETHHAMLRAAKGLFFRDRSWARVLESARADHVPLPEVERFSQWLPSGAVNQKRDDAILMLRAMHEFLVADPGPKEVQFVFEETLHWEELVRASAELRLQADSRADTIVLDELALDPEALLRAESAALGWWLARDEARRQRSSVHAAAVLDQSRAFCERHALADSAELVQWLETNRCDRHDIERLLESRAIVLAAQQAVPSALKATLLDYLRWSGDYAALLQRGCGSSVARK